MAQNNAVSAQGARLLRKVAKHILAEPLRYEQNEIIVFGKPGEYVHGYNFPRGTVACIGGYFPNCGTVACIGGWLNILTSKRKPSPGRRLPFRKLTRLLGVSESQFARLTAYTWNESMSGWPRQFRTAYWIAKTPLEKAKIANERIEHFIKTGE